MRTILKILVLSRFYFKVYLKNLFSICYTGFIHVYDIKFFFKEKSGLLI